MSRVKKLNAMLLELGKHGDTYLMMFGQLIEQGVDIESALHQCYKELVVKPKQDINKDVKS